VPFIHPHNSFVVRTGIMSDTQSASVTNALAQSYSSELLAANANWARRLNQTFPQYFANPKVKQAPKIIWLGCSDSRVHESDALATLPGVTFGHRNIANQVHPNDDSVLSVLAYALGVLETQHIAVVGHSHCGGVISALNNRHWPLPDVTKDEYTLQDSLYDTAESPEGHHPYDAQSKEPGDVITRWLEPLVGHLSGIEFPQDKEAELKAAVAENVKLQVDNFTKAPLNGFVRTAAKKKPVWVHGWVYDLENGFIQDLNITKVIR